MNGLLIQRVEPDSSVARAGIRAGDRLLAIDSLLPRDLIDVQLDFADARQLTIGRPGGKTLTLRATEPLEPAALSFEDPVPGGIRECNNHCEFCFIRGLPAGLRPSLYVFDDDYRYSFLWGNFLTLTNLDETDWARIGFQRLSPLNVSVHASDPDIRRRLLNNRHAPAILPQLERLSDLGIEVNAQVVLCAGINDGDVLSRTIEDLSKLYPSVRSLSVVPVGLTRYSRVKNIQRPTQSEAGVAIDQIEARQRDLRERHAVGFVYGSDELYLLGGRALPPAESYDGFPVLANGVGLMRSMLDEWRHLLEGLTTKRKPAQRHVAWITGRLAAPALEVMASCWQAYAGWRPAVTTVDNEFFGDEVTVSGLLSGADLIRALHALSPAIQDVVLPRGPFGFDGRCTLDGVSAEAVGDAHPGRVHLASSPRELLAILRRS